MGISYPTIQKWCRSISILAWSNFNRQKIVSVDELASIYAFSRRKKRMKSKWKPWTFQFIPFLIAMPNIPGGCFLLRSHSAWPYWFDCNSENCSGNTHFGPLKEVEDTYNSGAALLFRFLAKSIECSFVNCRNKCVVGGADIRWSWEMQIKYRVAICKYRTALTINKITNIESFESEKLWRT